MQRFLSLFAGVMFWQITIREYKNTNFKCKVG